MKHCIAFLLALSAMTSSACMTFVVGRKLSATGRVIVGHNEDDWPPCECFHGLVPARDWSTNAVLPATAGCNARIPQAAHTLSFYWGEVKFPYGDGNADTFLNEKGVLVVSDAGGETTERMDDPSLLTDGGIKFNLRRAVGERATSARDGVRILCELVEKYGYAPAARIYTVADKDEAWLVQVVHGKNYVAVRCPDDEVTIMPNLYTVYELEDYRPGEILVSSNLLSNAREKGFWDGKGKFNFAKAYQGSYATKDYPENVEQTFEHPNNTGRFRQAIRLLTGREWPSGMPFPFSVKPKAAKVSADDLREVLTAHNGEIKDGRHVLETWSICSSTTIESELCVFAADARDNEMQVALGRGCEKPYHRFRPFRDGLPREMDDSSTAVERLRTHVEKVAVPRPARRLVVGVSDFCSPANRAPSSYCEAISRAGHVPVVIPRQKDSAAVHAALKKVDLLLMTGGEDVDPARYGEKPSPHLGTVNAARDDFDFMLLAEAKKMRRPIVGICRGMQALNVFFGGTLYQDLESEYEELRYKHQISPSDRPAHAITIESGSRLTQVLGRTSARVTSRHHQAVKRLAPGFRATAFSDDGVIEAIECADYPAAGVQFHPEMLATGICDPVATTFFVRLLEFAADSAMPTTDPADDWPEPDRIATDPVDLPELLRCEDGTIVKDVATWEGKRRGEILSFFERNVFGVRPVERPPDLAFAKIGEDVEAMGGTAVRLRRRVSFSGDFGKTNFTFVAFVPKAESPVPSFLLVSVRNAALNLDSDRVNRSGFWPAEEIVRRGYAAIAFDYAEVASDRYKDGTCDDGVFAALGPKPRTASSWGKLSAWAWAASRVMDWMETDSRLDARRVAVVGHSRGGKVALWAGATDPRFALVCANDSGCCGAKLHHVRLAYEESIGLLTTGMPGWFAAEFAKWNGKDFQMPYDQHELVALIAPRPVAIGSASADAGAGPYGEYLSARHASPAWELYGTSGIEPEAFPPIGGCLGAGRISYHLRSGKHDLTMADWKRYLDFADREMKGSRW